MMNAVYYNYSRDVAGRLTFQKLLELSKIKKKKNFKLLNIYLNTIW